ncbi:sugar nucleotide-binding protein [Candidatus Woesearchaeota archaeon]|nr:sugar nucleotide-binding protein [Candidatus Woesearchaeota archaeon]
MAIIIFGASGFLGGKLMQYFANAKKKAVGTYSNTKKENLIKFSLEKPELKALRINLKDYSHAIICSSITAMDKCKTEADKTYKINVVGTKKLIDQLWSKGITPIFISTDYVFDGKKGNYTEEDARKPVLEYGRHKKEIEEYLMSSKKKYIIVRTAKLYSITGDDETIVNSIIKDLKEGKELRMASDQYLSPTYVEDACKAIELIIDKNIIGTYNVCSDGRISRYELAKAIKETLGITTGKIMPCSLNDFKFQDNRPLDTSMSNRKFKELTNFSFTSIKEAITMIKDMQKITECALCKGKLGGSLELGRQAVSNHFLIRKDYKEKFHPLALAQCTECGLVQLSQRFPAEALKPIHDWIVYLEPEEHLDKLTEDIIKKTQLKPNLKTRFIGVSSKDDSLLERLRKKGYATDRLDLKKDLGVDDEKVGVETIQDRMKPEIMKRIADNKGLFDVVIARHILEHAYNLKEFISAMKTLVKPKGYLMIEVPDCAHGFARLDYPIIWEEHTLYFTPETFKNTIASNGLEIKYYNAFEYALENSLVIMAQNTGKKSDSKKKKNSKSRIKKEILKKEKDAFNNYCKSKDKRKEEIIKFITDNKQDARIAVLGAGHFSCGFINYLGLKDYIDIVIDDNPNKRGLYMPMSRTPILGSEELQRNIKLCLLGVNPRGEENVIARYKDFVTKGGMFYSIFANSRHALPLKDK